MPSRASLVTLCKCAKCIDFPPHLMGKQCVHQYKNGFRNFSYRRETTKLGGKRNMDAIITTPITTNHHYQRGRERERVRWVEFRGYIANSNRNQCFENRLLNWFFIEYSAWSVVVVIVTIVQDLYKFETMLLHLVYFKEAWEIQ